MRRDARALQIVFRQTRLDHANTKPLGPRRLIRRRLARLDQAFQAAGSGRVVVDALIVQGDGQGAEEVGPQAARTDEAVLHPHDRPLEGVGGGADLRRLLAGPPDQLAARGARMGDGGAGSPEIADAALGRVQQTAHRRPLGRGETDGGPVARQPVGPVAQGDQPLQRLFGLASLAGHRIDVAGVGDQRRRRDLLQITRCAPLSGLHRVGRKPPAGIEGRAEAAHRQTAQQGFEPQG
ncbi:hypothetical protein D3C86_1358140 [compost metagenome]